MKQQLITRTTASPAIFTLLPEDHFFQVIADIHRLIARRAYELFCARGSTDGHDVADWLKAESEILESGPLEISETQDAINAKAKLPGCHAKDIEIHVEPRRLFVSGQREEKTDDKNGKQIHCERQIFCSVDLPAPIDPEKANANLIDGQLLIELPKSKMGKEIPITAKAAAA